MNVLRSRQSSEQSYQVGHFVFEIILVETNWGITEYLSNNTAKLPKAIHWFLRMQRTRTITFHSAYWNKEYLPGYGGESSKRKKQESLFFSEFFIYSGINGIKFAFSISSSNPTGNNNRSGEFSQTREISYQSTAVETAIVTKTKYRSTTKTESVFLHFIFIRILAGELKHIRNT